MSPEAVSPPPGRDPGLQPERTAMSWHRTGISAIMIGATATFAAARWTGLLLVGLSALVTVGAAAAVGYVSTREQPDLSDWLPSPWHRLVSTSAVVVLMAILGVGLAFWPGHD